MNCSLIKHLKGLKSDNRLLLTGTPLQVMVPAVPTAPSGDPAVDPESIAGQLRELATTLAGLLRPASITTPLLTSIDWPLPRPCTTSPTAPASGIDPQIMLSNRVACWLNLPIRTTYRSCGRCWTLSCPMCLTISTRSKCGSISQRSEKIRVSLLSNLRYNLLIYKLTVFWLW